MKKKGFTLIELLAVIVVLALIALIATPTILGVIEKSRKSSYKASMYGIVKAADIYLAESLGKISNNDEMIFTCDGIKCSNGEGEKLSFKGEVPKSGNIYVRGNGVVTVESVYNGRYYANTVNDDIEITKEDTSLTKAELTNMVKELQQKISNLEQQNNTMKSEINSIKVSNITVEDVYPVGSIYISTSNIDPSNLFHGTKWEIFGENRMLMGVGKSEESEKVGGNNTVTLTKSNLPSHSHLIPELTGLTSTSGSHTHSLNNATNVFRWDGGVSGNIVPTIGSNTEMFGGYSITVNSSGAHSHTITTNSSTTGLTGENQSFSVQNPYITVYIWKRVS